MHDMHDHSAHTPNAFKQKFWGSVLLTLPVLVFSGTIQSWFHYSLTFTGSKFIPAIFGIILFLYGGWVFVAGAKDELVNKQPGMMTLIAMAMSVAFIYSVVVTFGVVRGMGFWWELATLIDIMLLGHWIEMSSISKAGSALHELAALLPDQAEVVQGSVTKKVAIHMLQTGDIVRIRPGASVPADAVVLNGSSEIDESMVTGESRPIVKNKGDELIAGTINTGDGAVTATVTKIGDQTMLAGIMRLVKEAEQSKGKSQRLADMIAAYLFYVALSVATLTLIGWTIVGGRTTDFVLERVVTVLIIACPHALGLAIPLVIAIATSRAARHGFLIRKQAAFETARRVDVVAFDKTGTLTTGQQVVDAVIARDDQHVLSVAASVEILSEHSIGKAIVAEVKKQKIATNDAKKFAIIKGQGAEASVHKKHVIVGTKKLLQTKGVAVPESTDVTNELNAGKTVIYVAEDKKYIGAISLSDGIRPESHAAIKRLQQNGIKVIMLTGDGDEVAAHVAEQLGIKTYYAQVLPAGKIDLIKKLQLQHHIVAMVGDGVNDAAALTQANVGIAMGAGTNVAIESADIVLVTSDPRAVMRSLSLAQATYRKMQQNLVWAIGYNAVTLPLATGITAGVGFVLSPAVGAVMMSLSTIIVALNAQLLRRVRL